MNLDLTNNPYRGTGLTILLLVASVAHAQPGPGRGGAPVPVVVSPVEQVKNFADRVEALGTTRSNESVDLTANVTEKVEKLHFEDGQEVKAGELLVELEASEEISALKAARALYDERKAAYDRARELEQQRALSTATLEEREALLRQSEGEIEVLQSQIDDRRIQAPFDGVLGLREISPGALVRPGDRITTVDDLSRIKVDFDVPSTLLGTLRPGLPIEGKVDAYPDRTFRGKIEMVGTRVNPVTRTITARAILPNEEMLLRPGLLIRIVLLKRPRNALLIPEGALIQRGESFYVLAIDRSGNSPVAEERQVGIGSRTGGSAEIISGLQAGDLVVVHGLMQVRPGQPVRIEATKTDDATLRELIGEEAPGRSEAGS